MSSRPITSPEDQSATFIELFFDLVFVFAVTQVVSLLHDGIDALHVGQSVLAFWLVWWAWTQFTWALNAADTTHPAVELGVLVATAVAFFMAVALPDAFGERALAFAIPYIMVRVLGLVLYGWVASGDRSQHAAVRLFSIASAGGLIAVAVGAMLGGVAQYWLWGGAILLDIIAAAAGGNLEGWNLHPEHFSERHGLFVIIALGESLIVAAGGLAGAEWNGELVTVVILGVCVTFVLWWSYFAQQKPVLDRELDARTGAAQSCLARDAYSLIHFPMVCGIIGFAAALEEVLLHPADPLPTGGRLALGASLLLFVGGMGLARWRATTRLPVFRIAVTIATAVAVFLLSSVSPAGLLVVAFAGMLVVVLVEERLGSPDAPSAETVPMHH